MSQGCFRCFKDVLSGALSDVLSDALMITLTLFCVYWQVLDIVDAIIQGMAREQEVINKSAPVEKMQNLVRNVTRTGKPEKDYVIAPQFGTQYIDACER